MTPLGSARSIPSTRELNQYHVILETDPKFQLNPQNLHDIYIQSVFDQQYLFDAAASNTAGSSSGAGSGVAPSTGNALLTPSSTAGVSSSAPRHLGAFSEQYRHDIGHVRA